MKYETGDIVKGIIEQRDHQPSGPTIGVICGQIIRDNILKYMFEPLLDDDCTVILSENRLELIKRGNTAIYREKLLMGEEF